MKLYYSCTFCVWVVTVQIEIDIEPTVKVECIKERVEEKEGIPPQQQCLIFSGQQMYLHFKCRFVHLYKTEIVYLP